MFLIYLNTLLYFHSISPRRILYFPCLPPMSIFLRITQKVLLASFKRHSHDLSDVQFSQSFSCPCDH